MSERQGRFGFRRQVKTICASCFEIVLVQDDGAQRQESFKSVTLTNTLHENTWLCRVSGTKDALSFYPTGLLRTVHKGPAIMVTYVAPRHTIKVDAQQVLVKIMKLCNIPHEVSAPKK